MNGFGYFGQQQQPQLGGGYPQLGGGYWQQQLGGGYWGQPRDTVYLTAEQQSAQSLAGICNCFLLLLMLPVTVLDILAIARAGQNVKGIALACGDSFFSFIIANMSLNWLMCLCVLMTAIYLYNIDANALLQRSNTTAYSLAFVAFLYAIFSIASIVIVAVSMSTRDCSKAIELVSWGQPLLGIVGYLNMAINLLVLIGASGLACKLHVSTTQYLRVGQAAYQQPQTYHLSQPQTYQHEQQPMLRAAEREEYEVPLSTTKRSRQITSTGVVPLYDFTGDLEKQHESLLGKFKETLNKALAKQQHVVVVAPPPAAAVLPPLITPAVGPPFHT